MPGGLTDEGQNTVLDLLFGSENPDFWYVGLVMSEPLAEDTGATVDEPDNADYHRVEVPNDEDYWLPASNGEKMNAQDISWDEPTTDWGIMRFVVLCDEDEGGGLIAWARLPLSRAVVEGKRPWIPARMLSFNAYAPEV